MRILDAGQKKLVRHIYCLGAWMSLQECGTKIIYIHTDLCSCCHFHQEYHSLLVKIFPLISQDRRHLTWTMLAENMFPSEAPWQIYSTFTLLLLSLSSINFLPFFFTATIPVQRPSDLYFIHFRNAQDLTRVSSIWVYEYITNVCWTNRATIRDML